jgi:VCBS repeat protein
MLKRVTGSPLFWTAAFLFLILALNADLFRKPYIEITDFAANSLLVQQARQLKLLTGHYSRWHFHHPGPAYLYVFALGEFAFHDLLHVAPAPFNAQIIITIILNVTLLWAVFCIIRRHCDRFPAPLALAATTIVAVLVNRNTQPSMLISNWMPDVLLFSFLLFVVSAASVLAGQTRDVPFLTLSGMLLVHAHIAQILFVGIVGGGTVAWILARALRIGRLRPFLRENRRYFTLAVGICALFFLPILLDLILHRPNNLNDIRAYLSRQSGHRNTILASVAYLFCFAAFIHNPEAVLPARSGRVLLDYVWAHPAAIIYWALFALVCLVTLALARRDVTALVRGFLKYLLLVAAAALVLFLYWGIRITGEMFAFNGRFIYAIHLIVWFAVLTELGRHLSERQNRIWAGVAAAFVLVFALVERNALRPQILASPDARHAAMAAPWRPPGRLEITFESSDWPWAVAVANQMQRLGKQFCVGPDWGFMFSREHVCPDELRADKLAVARGHPTCVSPCRMIFSGADLSATNYPADLSLPLEIGFTDSASVVRTGFNESQGTYCWTSSQATIRFPLTADLPQTGCFELLLKGFTDSGRSVQVSLNGHPLGTWTAETPSIGTFTVPRDAIRPGGINLVSLDASAAASGGHGYGFMSFVLRMRDSGEACSGSPPPPTYAPLVRPGMLVPYDFNRDGRTDIVWQNPSGAGQVWFMGGVQGITHIGSGLLDKANAWRIVAAADFNRDGHPDLVWQDPVSGRSEVRYLGGPEGTTTLGTVPLTAARTRRIAAVADFNRDGHPDVVWQDPASGQASIEYFGGPQGITSLGVTELATKNNWRIAGAGDFNLDGHPDLLWQDPVRGTLQIWFLGGTNGISVVGSANIPGTIQTWRVAAVADFNLDGHPDLVWQDPASGASQIWFLNGADGRSLLGTSAVAGPESGRIAGPR